MKVIQNEEQIKKILEKDYKSRDDDMRLLALMYYNYIEKRYSTRVLSQCKPMLELISKGGVPHFETVRRTRQKLQETDEALWGDKIKKRHEKEQTEAQKSIRDFKG